MNESNAESIPLDVACAAVLDRLARDMVSALDRILDHLMAAAPAEGAGSEVPLTLQEVHVVKTIAPRESISMSTLASSMGISLPTATHLVDRLVTKGVAVRTRPEHARRLVLVALSEQAKARERAFFENRVALVLNILAALTPAERGQVVRALGEIARVVQSRAASQAGLQTPNENIISEAQRHIL